MKLRAAHHFGPFSHLIGFCLALSLASPVLATEQAWATLADTANCSTVSLIEPGSPFDQIPIYDQREVNSCYAYAASQMLDYHRIQNEGENISLSSPDWMALAHKSTAKIHWSRDRLDFSRLSWTFKQTRKNGVCREEVIHQAFERARNGNAKLSDSDLLYFYQNLWDEFQYQRKLGYDRDTAYLNAYDQTVSDRYLRGKVEFPLLAQFEWMAHTRSKSKLDALKEEMFSECTGSNMEPRDFPRAVNAVAGFASDRKVYRVLDRLLDTPNPQPVGIGYCYEVLDYGKGYRGVGRGVRPRLIAAAMSGRCGAHYSVVVGRRKTQDSCQYLIRNSLGTGFWTTEWDCMCQSAPGAPLEECHAQSGHSGQVVGCWIDREDLAANTFEMTYFLN